MDVVEPAVIEAAQPAVLYPGVAEVGCTMSAMDAKQTDAVELIAKEHEVFAEQAHRKRGATRRDLRTERNGLPVTAYERAAGRPGANLSQEVVLLAGQHAPPRDLRRGYSVGKVHASQPDQSAAAVLVRRSCYRSCLGL